MAGEASSLSRTDRIILGVIIVLMLALIGLCGTIEYQSELAWQQAWAELNGVEVTNEAG